MTNCGELVYQLGVISASLTSRRFTGIRSGKDIYNSEMWGSITVYL